MAVDESMFWRHIYVFSLFFPILCVCFLYLFYITCFGCPENALRPSFEWDLFYKIITFSISREITWIKSIKMIRTKISTFMSNIMKVCWKYNRNHVKWNIKWAREITQCDKVTQIIFIISTVKTHWKWQWVFVENFWGSWN